MQLKLGGLLAEFFLGDIWYSLSLDQRTVDNGGQHFDGKSVLVAQCILLAKIVSPC